MTEITNKFEVRCYKCGRLIPPGQARQIQKTFKPKRNWQRNQETPVWIHAKECLPEPDPAYEAYLMGVSDPRD